MILPDPLYTFREMICGSLHPRLRENPSASLFMILQLRPDEQVFAPSVPLAEYVERMQPVFQLIEEERLQREGNRPIQVHEPGVSGRHTIYSTQHTGSSGFMPSLQKPVRFTLNTEWTPATAEEAIWRGVIIREAERLLSVIMDLIDSTKDDDVHYYELQNIGVQIDGLLELLEDQKHNSGDEPEPDFVFRLLRYELSALWMEVRLRMNEPENAAAEKRVPAFSQRQPVPLAPAWWQQKIEKLLDGWKAKYHNTAPVAEMVKLIDAMTVEKQQAAGIYKSPGPVNPPENMDGLNRHAQIILFLMVIGRIKNEKIKNGVKKLKTAENQLRLVDDQIRFGGETTEEQGEIYTFSDKLEKADADHNVTRFPLINERNEQIRAIINHSFRKPIEPAGTNSDAPVDSHTIMTAEERFRHEFLTIKQLADMHQVKDRTIRNNLEKYGIPTIKRAGVQYVRYEDYVKAGE